MTKPAIPPSPEVLAAQALQLDPALQREATALREQLEPLVSEIVPLLGQVVALMDRACDVAEMVAPRDPSDVLAYVLEASGVRELDRIFERIGDAFPLGAVEYAA